MPIAQIIISPSLESTTKEMGDVLAKEIKADLVEILKAAPDTVQVVIQKTLVQPVGREVLCLVHHRANEYRTKEVRLAAAQALHDRLHVSLGATARVRLIAISGDEIAAVDTKLV